MRCGVWGVGATESRRTLLGETASTALMNPRGKGGGLPRLLSISVLWSRLTAGRVIVYKNRSGWNRGDPRIIPPLRNRPLLSKLMIITNYLFCCIVHKFATQSLCVLYFRQYNMDCCPLSAAAVYITQRPCITRQWTPAVLCLGWLDVY